MRAIVTITLFCGLTSLAEAKPRKRAPLTVRTKNPCALSWSYSHAPGTPTGLFWKLQEAGVPVAKGPPDSLGNRVMRFASHEDGLRACVLLLESDEYRNLTVVEAIKKWSGGHSSRAYARYVSRRAGLKLEWRIGRLSLRGLRNLIRAMTEWESGAT